VSELAVLRRWAREFHASAGSPVSKLAIAGLVLLAGDQVRLAPLYDVASALPYPEVHVRRP
jgi:hypothetical protein